MLERGRADGVSLRTIRGIAQALGLRLDWDVGWRGTELARLRDSDHAALAEALSRFLQSDGWEVVAEVSFNHFGDRGRIDLLAYHAASGAVLVIEIKTVIADVQSLLGSLDVKVRLAPRLAATRGWQPRSVTPMLLVLDTRTNRRRIRDHQQLFAGLAVRGWAARSWLREPEGDPGGLLLFQFCQIAMRVTLGEPDASACGLRTPPHAQGARFPPLRSPNSLPKRDQGAIWRNFHSPARLSAIKARSGRTSTTRPA